MTSPLSDAELSAVARVMKEGGALLGGPLQASEIARGRSNVTLRLDDGVHAWVLRMPPRVGRTPSAHDVVREYRVAAALRRTGVPVATVTVLCEDEALLGVPFAVAEFVSGSSIQTSEELDELTDDAVSRTCVELVETLAALHSVDHESVGLGDFGRPSGYAERQLRRWSGQWDIVGPPGLADLERDALTMLRESVPSQCHVSIVHGDYRIDNTILALEGDVPRVAAVVDWELSTIGDPVADVAMMCAYRLEAFDKVIGAPTAWASPRLPSVDQLVGRYESAAGTSLGDWAFHLALAYYKIAIIAAGIAHRHEAGAGDDEVSSASQAVEPFLAQALITARNL